MSYEELDKELIKYKPNSVIFCEGEPSLHMYIIKRGEVRIFKESDGSLLPISVLRSREFLGELSILDDNLRSASAITTDDTELFQIKKTEIQDIIKSCPEWVEVIFNTLCTRLKDSAEVLRDHQIIDDSSGNMEELSAKSLTHFKSLIADYKKKRNIK